MASCATCPWKFLIWILSVIMWAVAVILMAVGIVVFVELGDFSNFTSEIHTLVPATIFIATSVLLILVGFMGCIGACKEHKCTLGFFFVFAGVIFLLQIVGASLAFAYKGTLDDKIESEFTKGLEEYNNSTSWQDEIDFFQKDLKCCGVSNYTDWETTSFYVEHHSYPESCCPAPAKGANTTICQPSTVGFHTEGCYAKTKDFFINNLNVIAGVGLGFALVEIFALIGVLFLYCRRDPGYDTF